MSRSQPDALPYPRIIRLAATCLAVLPLLFMSGCRRTPAVTGIPIVVAAYGTPEQQVLAEITIQLLRAHGYTVTVKTQMQSAWHVRRALEAGSVHLAWQDTASVWFEHLGHDQPITSDTSLLREVMREDDLHNIVWLTPLPWSSRQSIVMPAEYAQLARIGSIADLAEHVNRVNPGIRLCVPESLYQSARGITGMERVYGFDFQSSKVSFMDPPDAFAALVEGRCDATIGSDKDLAMYEGTLVRLRDSRAFFSASSLAPTVHVACFNQYPQLEPLLGKLTAALDAGALSLMERDVSLGKERLDRITLRFLSAKGLTNDR